MASGQQVKGEILEDNRENPKPKPTWVKVLTCVGCPFILIYYSVIIYCLPCLGAYISRFCCKCWCLICGCCRNCCHYEDSEFPADKSSLGDIPGGADNVVWKTAGEITEGKGYLFAGKIEPSDIAQGKLGDCWLLSALAALAEFPGAINRCFVTTTYSQLGKYKVRFYDRMQDKWTVITVDDRFPCDAQGHPVFTKPKDNELWVLILEKAFAKFCGSYAKLEGGQALWAFEALTGDFVMRWQRNDNHWGRWNVVHLKDASNKRAIGLRDSNEVLDDGKMFDLLKKYDQRQAIIAASSDGQDEKKNDNGIVQGHAYTINKVVEKDGFQLLRLRNPWGTFEWKGDWSDNSPLWEQHSSVRSACKAEAKDDGMFWMSWQDFQRNYKNIDICVRTSGFKDIAIDLHEDMGCQGPCRGCCCGCLEYWLCCLGCRQLCCAHQTQKETLRV